MATTPKTLALVEITSTDLIEVYLAASGVNTSVSVLSFTNVTTTDQQIDIYINDATSDFLQKTMTLPGGVGKERLYYGFQRKMINANYKIKVQASAATAFNVGVFGREIEIDGS